MKSAMIREYGSNEVLELVEVSQPSPHAGEVLVKVCAAGVNPIDWKIRSGAGARMGLTLPINLGSEIVGIVEEVGTGVSNVQLGEAVFGMVSSGAFAEYAVAKATDLVRKPVNLDFINAAALPLAGSTAWQAMFDEAGLSEGQRLLVTNSSGGVGSLAIQFAKAKGAHVTALASTRNLDFVRSLGADEVVDYTSQAFEYTIFDIDVVLDTVGGDTFQRAFSTIRKGGKMVTVVAFPQGEAERYGIVTKRSYTVPSARNLTRIKELVEAGKVIPYVEAAMPLADIKQALALSEAGRARGKIVLEMGS